MSPLAALSPIILKLGNLSAVLHWAASQRPQWTVAEVVIQDEFTHDVVLAIADQPTALVLDCT